MSKKTCKHCQQSKDSTEFWRHSGFKDGLNSSCKSCEGARIKERIRARSQHRDTSGTSHKLCSACRTEKPISEFFRDRSKKLGVCSSCKECSLRRAEIWKLNNPDRAKEIQKSSWERRREGLLIYHKLWTNLSRRTQRAKNMPGWADDFAIAEFYRNCPPGYQVDHIIPFNGRHVTGLHVLENLQYLTKDENAKKGNRFHVHPF